MSFKELAEELGALATASQESTPAAGAGVEGGAGNAAVPMAKSFQFTLEDGSVVDAVDGAELVKSLTERFDASESARITETAELKVALGSMTTLIKSLTATVAKLSGQGAGRRSALATDPGAAGAGGGGGAPAKPNGHELMAKASSALEAGRMTALEVGVLEGHLNRGMPPPAELMAKAMGAGA